MGKVLMMRKGNVHTISSLPTGYTKLSYIQSSGAQYIDTGIAHSSTDNIILSMRLSYDTVTPTNQIMGFSGSGGCGIGISKSAWWEVSNLPAAEVGKEYFVEYGVNGANYYRSVDGNKFENTRSSYTFTTNMYLFAAQGSVSSTSMAYYCSCKLYEAKIEVNGKTVRNFIPCINATGEIGLYDTITKTFFSNGGTGDFISGDLVVSLPSGYTRFAYIQGTGTQCIDTGVVGTDKTKILVKASSNSGNFYISLVETSRFGIYLIDGGRVDMAFGGSGYVGSVLTGLTYPAVVTLENGSVTSGSSVYTFNTQSAFSTTKTLPIFGHITSSATTYQYGECYYCNIYEDGKLIKQLIPCSNPSGEMGMYDTVTKTFHGNIGTGEFVGGIA